jgi:UDP-glucose 4-epimerase
MTILVTGASGLLGRHLCARLLRDGYRVVGLVHHEPLRLENREGSRFTSCVGDITDVSSLERIFRGHDIEGVFHLAAALPYDRNPQYYDVNVVGSRIVLNMCIAHKVKFFVFASSMSVYGRPEYLPVDEGHPANPDNGYGCSKLDTEKDIPLYGIPYTILRYSGMYGAGQKKGRAVKNFVSQALKGEPITVDGDGSQSSDFVYVEDAGEGTMLAMSKHSQGIFNIGSGQETSLLELARMVVEITGSRSEIVLGGGPVDRPFRFVSDIGKAKRELGYCSSGLVDELRRYIEDIRSKKCRLH